MPSPMEASPRSVSREETLESRLHTVLEENPIVHIEGMLSASLIREIELYRQAYFTSYTLYFRKRTEETYERAESARKEYGKIAEKVRKELRTHKGIDERYRGELLRAFVEGESKRLQRLKELTSAVQVNVKEKKKGSVTPGFKGRILATALAAVSASSAYQQFEGVNPFPIQPSVSSASSSGERASSGTEVPVTEQYTAEVKKNDGAIETLTRILGQMNQEHKRELFAALEIELTADTEEQADALSRRLNLLNRQGRSALIPENSYFHYDNGTLTLHTPYKTFELIHSVTRTEEGGIRSVNTTKYNGRFQVQSSE